MQEGYGWVVELVKELCDKVDEARRVNDNVMFLANSFSR